MKDTSKVYTEADKKISASPISESKETDATVKPIHDLTKFKNTFKRAIQNLKSSKAFEMKSNMTYNPGEKQDHKQ